MERVTREPGGTLKVDDPTSVARIFNNRLSYAKGAMVLHMLRWILGDEIFFKSIRDYLKDPSLSYGYARTSDLQRHLEETSGRNLSGFFDDWYSGEGYPVYQLSWTMEKNGLAIQLLQTNAHSSDRFFELPLPIGIYGNGRDSILVLDQNLPKQNFFLPMDWAVDSVAIDPDRWIITAGNTVLKLPVNTTDHKDNFAISLWPLPADQFVHYAISDFSAPLEIILSDAMGNALLKQQLTEEKGILDVQELPAGLYILQGSNARGKFCQKIILK